MRIEAEDGFFEVTGDEIHVFSKGNDPAGVRIGAREGIALGKIAFYRLLVDDEGKERQEEMVLIQGKQDERTRDDPYNFSGEITIHIRDHNAPGDGMIKVMEIRHNSIWIKGINDGGG